MAYRLLTTCVAVGVSGIDDLKAMYEADREIGYETLARRVGVEVLSEVFSDLYCWGRERGGLRMCDDRMVRFYRSEFRGQPVYHVDHSRIDYIFVEV